MISQHYIYVVVTGNLNIVTTVFNNNYIEIRNKTKVGKGFILFIKDLKIVSYLIIDILGDIFIRTGKCEVINLSYKIDSFSSRLIYSYVYSAIMGSSSKNHFLQDLVDKISPKST